MTRRRKSKRYGRKIKLTAYQWMWVGVASAAVAIMVLTQIANASRVIIAIVSFLLGVSATLLISMGDTKHRIGRPRIRRITPKSNPREPSLVYPPRSKDRNKWPLLETEEVPELRPERKPAADTSGYKMRRINEGMPPPKRNIMAELLDEDDGEPENGFHEIRWEPVSAEDHRTLFHQQLQDKKSGDLP